MGHDQPQKTRISKREGGVFTLCRGFFLWEMTVYTTAPPANAGNFPLWPHSKFCFSAWFLAFFALQVVFVFVPLARFLDFRKCFHAHKWAGACFSLYDIGQTGATSHPLPDCAPRSGRDTRTACPRWKPYSTPRREELYRILARLHNAQQARTQTAHSTKARPTTTPDRLFLFCMMKPGTPGGHDQAHAHPVRRSMIAYVEPLFQTFL